MEDKIMKLTKLTILLCSTLLLISLASSEGKPIKKDHFMQINPNITNEALRAELENLVMDFDAERQRVHDSYAKQIEVLKEERRLEIKSMKNEFGEDRKKTKPAIKPNMEKREKGKKPLRKSK